MTTCPRGMKRSLGNKTPLLRFPSFCSFFRPAVSAEELRRKLLSTNGLGPGRIPLRTMSSRVVEDFAHPCGTISRAAGGRRQGSGVFGRRRLSKWNRVAGQRLPTPLLKHRRGTSMVSQHRQKIRTCSVRLAVMIFGNLVERKMGDGARGSPCALAPTLRVCRSIACMKCLEVPGDAYVGKNTTWLTAAPVFARGVNFRDPTERENTRFFAAQVNARREIALTRRKYWTGLELARQLGVELPRIGVNHGTVA